MLVRIVLATSAPVRRSSKTSVSCGSSLIVSKTRPKFIQQPSHQLHAHSRDFGNPRECDGAAFPDQTGRHPILDILILFNKPLPKLSPGRVDQLLFEVELFQIDQSFLISAAESPDLPQF